MPKASDFIAWLEGEAAEEEWRDVADWEGLYQVSNLGRVRSLDRCAPGRPGRIQHLRGRVLTQFSRTANYKEVNLVDALNDKPRRAVKVHRLVAEAFIQNPNKLPYVNHKDEKPENNCVSNLEWCDAKYNTNYGGCREKLRAIKKPRGGKMVAAFDKNGVERIRIKPISSAADYGLSVGCVRIALSGAIKTYHGLTWRYVDEQSDTKAA